MSQPRIPDPSLDPVEFSPDQFTPHESSLLEQGAQSPPLRGRVRTSLDRLRRELLEERVAEGHWVGELSPSALSTATAVSAIAATLIHGPPPELDRSRLAHCLERGIESLRCQQNGDGGFGDTDRSHSNIATSYLVLAASGLAERAVGQSLTAQQVDSLRDYLRQQGEFDALRARYGTDKTFVVPILTNLAIAGLVDWNQIPALPFEAAIFPQSMYRLLRMPVVSYAIPALVAIGQTRHFHGRRAPIPLRWIRAASVPRTMRVLRRMQPESGGYLEATPLTSFVVMSLAVTGRGNHEVCRSGLQFLVDSMNETGSWPIDTNLATWVTSLSMQALASDPLDDGRWCSESLVDWHLSCQHRDRHPFTGAEPGGWGWSDLSGAVPDSDDTPAAILALGQSLRWCHEASRRDQVKAAMLAGTDWLRRLQNRDGGWPTFCRGWGKLPFDRSSNDLTAHAIRALNAVHRLMAGESGDFAHQLQRAKAFLQKNQQADGSWLPLWFGNQDRSDESNPVYGTSRVLATGARFLPDESVRRGCQYLVAMQNQDGGWGGGPSVTHWLEKTNHRSYADCQSVDEEIAPALPSPAGSPESTISSMEETALAVEALAIVYASRRHWEIERNQSRSGGVVSKLSASRTPSEDRPQVADSVENRFVEPWLNPQSLAEVPVGGGKPALTEAIIRGIEFLLKGVDEQRHRVAWPIGFYFAKLWYHERLYPLIFTTAALGTFLKATVATEVQE